MCLTIPKKVVEIEENNAIVELPDGNRQKVKSIVDLDIGDYCLTQQNVAIEKIEKEEAETALNILSGLERNSS